MYKQLLGILGIALTFIAFVPYIHSIRRGKTRPHVFSWVIWSLTTLVVFFAQLAGGGGFGAWPTGVSGIITVYIALLAYFQRADTHITRTDWAFFFSALSALPFWFLTNDPLWAVVTLTIVDVAGFGPTLRRAWIHPNDESMTFFSMIILRDLFVISALEHYSVTTVLFPAAVASTSALLILLVTYRRRNANRVN
jgi:hypothetical protein